MVERRALTTMQRCLLVKENQHARNPYTHESLTRKGLGVKLFDPEFFLRFHVRDVQMDVAPPDNSLAGRHQLRIRRDQYIQRKGGKEKCLHRSLSGLVFPAFNRVAYYLGQADRLSPERYAPKFLQIVPETHQGSGIAN